MAFNLEFDALSLTLLGLSLALALATRLGLLGSGSPPLVHPLLLGKQSEVSRTRKKGETGVYRNWAVGFSGAQLQTRPAGNVKTVKDVLVNDCGPRTILSGKASNADLRNQAQVLAAGLKSLIPTTSTAPTPIFCLLSPLDSFLLLHLAVGQSSHLHLVTLSSLTLLDTAIDRIIGGSKSSSVFICEAHLAQDIVEQLVDVAPAGAGVPVVVALGHNAESIASVLNKQTGGSVTVIPWDDVLGAGLRVSSSGSADEPDPTSLFCISFNADPSFSTAPGGRSPQPPMVQHITHQHMTAGIAAFLSAFPADKRPRSQDVVAIDVCDDLLESRHAVMAQSWVIALMLACVYVGASFILIDSNSCEEAEAAGPGMGQHPTLLFLRPATLASLNQSLERSAESIYRPLYAIARRQKLVGISGGCLGRDAISEALVWRRVRKGAGSRRVWLEDLRAAVILVGSAYPTLSAEDVDRARVCLSVPVSRFTMSARATGPILTTHFHDLQTTTTSYTASKQPDGLPHVGAVASNAEVLLRGTRVEELDSQSDPIGRLYARGPTVLRDSREGTSTDDWVDLHCEAAVRANGTFVLL